MKRLKKFNEINYNLSNINSINENLNINKYQFQLQKLMKQLKVDLYYVERHKLSIFAFYPLIDQLIKINNPDKEYTIQDILLIIICSINILSYENKDKSQKLLNIAVKNDIPESVLDYTIDVIRKIKGLFTIISEKFGKDIIKFIDMLSYTDLFIPFMNVLNILVEQNSIDFDNIDINSNDMKSKLLIDKIMKKLQFIINSTDKFQNKDNIKPLLVNDELKSPRFKKEKVFITESLKDKIKGKSIDEILDNIKNLPPQRQFEKSCIYGYIDIVKKFLEENKIDPSYEWNYCIRSASSNGYLDIVKELMKDDRVDPSDKNNESIILASSNGHVDVVKELLKDDRVDPSDINYHAFQLAISNNHIDVVKELLKDDRVDIGFNENYLIRYAMLNNNKEMFNLFLNNDKIDLSKDIDDIMKIASINRLDGFYKLLKEYKKNKL
jgi:ankyrin repeat protein